MMTVLGIVLFFLGILISIAWHELGHFTTARWFGIKVPEFMVGFGRTVWSRKVGETEFGLKAIPLGGYIRMIGMIPPAKGESLGRDRRTGPFQGLIDDARQQSAMDVRPEDHDRQFWMRAPWKRIVVMFAGPFMNLILAVVLFAIVLMGIGVPASSTTIGTVSACVVPASATSDTCPAGAPKTPAAAAGFQPGDRIVSFNGTPLDPDDGGALRAAIQGANGTVTVVVDRGGQLITLTPTLIDNQVEDAANPGQTVQASFLGVGLVGVYARQSLGAVFVQIGDIVGRTGEALVQLPSRVPGLFGSVFLGEQRDQNGPGRHRRRLPDRRPDPRARRARRRGAVVLPAAPGRGEHLAVPVQPPAHPAARRRADLPGHLGGHQEAGRAAARAARPRPGGRGEAHAGGLRGGAGVHRVERAAVRGRHHQPCRAPPVAIRGYWRS
jgi:membrane-associated protease RseP (regulator of RpoE activity)